MRRPKVDLNVSATDFIPTTPSPTPSPAPSPASSPDAQVHNLMPMTPSMLPNQQAQEDEEEQAKNFAILQMQSQLVRLFWENQKKDIEKTVIVYNTDHPLPLARIKRVMKSNKEVKMLSAEAPIVFAKACELFIMELTLRAWLQTEAGKRRTLQRCDIARALGLDEVFDFLVDFVLYDCQKGGLIPNKNPEAQQEVMMKPSLSMAEFDYGSTSKDFIPENPEAHQPPNVKPSFSLADFDYGSTSK